MHCRVGLTPPENEVRFENLTVDVEATPAENALPSIPGAYISFVQVRLPIACSAEDAQRMPYHDAAA